MEPRRASVVRHCPRGDGPQHLDSGLHISLRWATATDVKSKVRAILVERDSVAVLAVQEGQKWGLGEDRDRREEGGGKGGKEIDERKGRGRELEHRKRKRFQVPVRELRVHFVSAACLGLGHGGWGQDVNPC